MSSRNRVLFSGLMAVVLAAAIIGASAFAGYLPVTPTPSHAGKGTLSLLVTDPPQVPDGVTAVFITYNELAVHSVPNDLSHGWVELNVSGTVECMGLVNVSQTIAVSQVPSGRYDLIRLNVSGVSVTYDNLTYSAELSSHSFTAAFVGGLQVNGSQVSAALVDLQPMILNVGSDSSPQFVFRLSVSAMALVNSYVNVDLTRLGLRMDLGNMTWYRSFRMNETSSLTIKSATLTNDSLSVTVTNSGNKAQTIRFVVVTPSYFAGGPGPVQPMYRLPGFYGSVVFAVEANGSLQPASLLMPRLPIAPFVASWLREGGFNLTAGATETFSYQGAISTASDASGSESGTMKGSTGTALSGPGGSIVSPTPGRVVGSPTSYQITVIGDTASASVTVSLP